MIDNKRELEREELYKSIWENSRGTKRFSRWMGFQIICYWYDVLSLYFRKYYCLY